MESLGAALYQSTLKGLEGKHHETKIIDLYAENFDPVLVYNEDKRRRDMHLDPDLADYREQIKWADRLIFVYPIFFSFVLSTLMHVF